MLTKIIIRNFKRFKEVEVELGNPVVFIGPNNSGKTSALQALALWEIGLKRWNEKRKDKEKPEKRPGVTINRRDLLSVPVPNAKLLWRSLHVKEASRVNDKQETQNIYIEIVVEGITNDKQWQCGLEFYYANEESFYCRPLRLPGNKNQERMPIPKEAGEINVALLPPMSGLAANEPLLADGAINVRIGEGRTAEVLRNLCYKIYNQTDGRWLQLKEQIKSLFGVEIEDPQYIIERGEIVMQYREGRIGLDFSCSGRGLQQTLLLLAYMYANPGSVLLLDEPDAHLEILRQRQTYQFLTEAARKNGNQIIAASHSEVLLNEAADRDTVVAFVGKPHRISDRGAQAIKSLREIGFQHYHQAEQNGWVLYLEGSSDLIILQMFAKILTYEEAMKKLESPFVHYISDQPQKAREHFYGVQEAVPHLKGIALFDRLDKQMQSDTHLTFLMWNKKEIENYFCLPEVLESYARYDKELEEKAPLFSKSEADRRLTVMRDCMKKIEEAMTSLNKGSPWDANTKVSDEFLTPLFKNYFETLNLPNLMPKKNFYELARFLPKDRIDPEIKEKLTAIVEVAQSASPAVEEDP